MSTEKVVFVSCFSVSTIAFEFAVCIAIYYYSKKPTGKKTLLDKVMVMFLKISALGAPILHTSICIPDILGPSSRNLAMIWSGIELCLVLLLCLSMTSVMVVKYASIYHGPRLDEISDETFLNASKWVLLLSRHFLRSSTLSS